jgi:hypothetical protein
MRRIPRSEPVAFAGRIEALTGQRLIEPPQAGPVKQRPEPDSGGDPLARLEPLLASTEPGAEPGGEPFKPPSESAPEGEPLPPAPPGPPPDPQREAGIGGVNQPPPPLRETAAVLPVLAPVTPVEPPRAAAPAAPESPVQRPGPVEAAPLESPRPEPVVRDFVIEIEPPVSAAAGRVAIEVNERGGEVRIAVRTQDADLSRALAERLPELTEGLEQSGFGFEPLPEAGRSAGPASSDRSHSGAREDGAPGGDARPGREQQPGGRQGSRGQRQQWREIIQHQENES